MSELPSDKRVKTLKEAASSMDFDVLEAMENRIRDAARLPSALLPQVAQLLAALPPERLPESLKWVLESFCGLQTLNPKPLSPKPLTLNP